MKYLNGDYYVEVKDERYIIHAKENIILRKRDPSKNLSTHYQVQKEIQLGKNQRVVQNNGTLEAKSYPKRIQKPFIH